MHIAQLNIALARAPVDSPALAEFVALLDPVNALADAAPGFVWRLQTEDGNASSIRAFDDEWMIVNMSVWKSIADLSEFVYRSGHLDVMRRRREWFGHVRTHMALWWIAVGQIPSLAEGRQRLEHLQTHGPTPYAFTFKKRFTPGQEQVIDDVIGCLA